MRGIYEQLGFEPDEIERHIRGLERGYRATGSKAKPPSSKAVVREWDALKDTCARVVQQIDGLSDQAARGIRTAESVVDSPDPLGQLRDNAEYIHGMKLSVNIFDARTRNHGRQFRYPEPKSNALDQFVVLVARLFRDKTGRKPAIMSSDRVSGGALSLSYDFERLLLALAEDADVPTQGLVERFRRLRKAHMV